MGRNDDQIRCSFCNKSQAQVKKLIAGPNDTYICDECVEVCSEIIEEEMAYDENDESLVPEIESELTAFQQGYEEIRIQTLLSGEYDKDNAIVTLHAGAGGTESCDWCGILYRMYCRWAEKKGYSVEVLDYLDGEECYEDGRVQGRYEELVWCRGMIHSHMDDATDTNDGWILVEDGLPEGGEKVLVWYEYFRYGEYNRMFQTHGIGWQYDGHWSGDVSGTKARCIAWRPLPEPYKPKKLQTEEKPVQ